jgi:hypothetical protein
MDVARDIGAHRRVAAAAQDRAAAERLAREQQVRHRTTHSTGTAHRSGRCTAALEARRRSNSECSRFGHCL